MGATGAAKEGALRGEQEGSGDTQLGPLYQCPNMLRDRQNRYRESGTERERCVEAMRSRVKEVSLAEWDVSRRGSDLPNRVGQVIQLEDKGAINKREHSVETRVGRPMVQSRDRVGQPAGAEGDGMGRNEDMVQG